MNAKGLRLKTGVATYETELTETESKEVHQPDGGFAPACWCQTCRSSSGSNSPHASQPVDGFSRAAANNRAAPATGTERDEAFGPAIKTVEYVRQTRRSFASDGSQHCVGQPSGIAPAQVGQRRLIGKARSAADR